MGFLIGIIVLGVLSGLASGVPPLQLSYLRDGGPYVKLMREESTGKAVGVGGNEIEPRFRLNGTWIPWNYKLDLAVILDNDGVIGDQFTAPGKVLITANPSEPTRVITLHSNLLSIEAVGVSQVSDSNVEINVISVSNDTESERHFLVVEVDKELEEGEEYLIEIKFIAPISRDRTNGLYLSTYEDPVTKEERRQAVTQMEPLRARQLFPCFDEPGLKSTYEVNVTRGGNYSTLVNSELLGSEDLGNGYVRDVFGPSPLMPTYLFALVVSDFTHVEVESTVPRIPIRVYGRKDLVEKGAFNYSVKTTGEVFSRFNLYFNTSYPIRKMDSVAVPNKGGAMENYGLILYKQDLLVYLDGETSEQLRYDSTDVIAHEVAHQNFGNLVTCKWWSDLWLNEGFATYMSHLGAEWTNPEFKSREKMLNEIVQLAMDVDVGNLSHPLNNEVWSPSEVSEMFGFITYNKGGSIVRMIESFLTEGTMQKGLQYYLKEMESGAVDRDDLIRNLQKVVDEDDRLPLGVNVELIVYSWTNKKGFPLVRVNVEGDGVVISQEPYRDDGEVGLGLWYVPVTVVTQEAPDLVDKVPELWLKDEEVSVSRRHDTSTWIMINQDATGYYRVLYDAQLTSLIKNQLDMNNSVISPLSRSQLLDDYFTFAWHGKSKIETVLDLTSELKTEDHFTVWEVVFTHLQKPLHLFSGNQGEFLALRNYLLPLVDAALERQGGDRGIDRIFKSHLYDWACALGSLKCVDYATELLVLWKNSSVDPVPVDYSRTLYCAMVDSGGSDAFQWLEEKYLEEPVGSRKEWEYRDSLTCASETQVLQELLDSAVGSIPVKSDPDRLAIVWGIANNPVGRELVWNILTRRLEEFIENVGRGSVVSVVNVVSTLATFHRTQEEFNAVELFINTNSNVLQPVLDQLQISLDTIQGNIKWMSDFGEDILIWLGTNKMS